MSNTKPLSGATPEDIENLQLIVGFMREAQRVFESLPEALKTQVLDLHSESTSLNHCVRWGAQNSEEVLQIAEANTRPERSAGRKSRP